MYSFEMQQFIYLCNDSAMNRKKCLCKNLLNLLFIKNVQFIGFFFFSFNATEKFYKLDT